MENHCLKRLVVLKCVFAYDTHFFGNRNLCGIALVLNENAILDLEISRIFLDRSDLFDNSFVLTFISSDAFFDNERFAAMGTYPSLLNIIDLDFFITF